MKIVAIAFFAGLSTGCFAQFTTIRTPYGGATVPNHNYSYMMNNSYGSYNPKREFTIVLKGDTTIERKTRINTELKPQSLSVKMAKKKRIIVPADTKEIFWVTPQGWKATGIPADSCWLFRVADGKINAFSNVPVQGAEYAIAIQSGNDGAIVPLSVENLKGMTAEIDDPEFRKLLTKKKASAALVRYFEIATKAP